MKTLILFSIVLFAGCVGTSNERPNPVKAEDPNSICHRLGGQPAIEVSGVFPRLAMVADHSPLPFPLSKASDSVKQAMIDWVEAGAKRSNLNKK